MSSSILNTIKKMLGVGEDDTSFDTDIIIHINTVLMTLHQYGIGPVDGFSIEGASETWDQLLPGNKKIEAVKTYIYLKVKLIFDPPSTSVTVDSFKALADELEYRMKEQNENYPTPILEGESTSVAETEEDTHGFSDVSAYYEYLDELDREEIENADALLGGDG